VGGHRGAGGAAVAALDYLHDVFGLHLAATDIDKCADNGPDHVSEKTVGGDDKAVASVAETLPPGAPEVTYIGLYVGVQL